MPTLSELGTGARVAGPLLVLEIAPRTLGSHPATVLTLGDASARLPSAPFWSDARQRVAGLRPGDVVEVVGRIGAYRGRRQLEVETIRRVASDLVDLRSLLPTVGPVEPYWCALDQWRGDIRSPGLARVVALFYDDPAFRGRFEILPASLSSHHAALGGLLRHTYEVAAIGRTLAELAGADRDLVVAGALLHDLGKLESYLWEGRFDLTEAGALLGHVVLGARMLDRRVRQTAEGSCSARELDILLHLILSHHGKVEFGAAVPPATLEAEILHYADDASAKSASMVEALADPGNFAGAEGLSVRGIRQLDGRRVYRSGAEWKDNSAALKAERPPSRG
jgi:3'-5' exoribonuclease